MNIPNECENLWTDDLGEHVAGDYVIFKSHSVKPGVYELTVAIFLVDGFGYSLGNSSILII